ncbi:MAG: DUF1080 domain-containing protein [Pirellulaceae bacterium]|nr:DUF1080 domain-containing protein [Pirellulaceae bacterium]
MKRMLLLNAFIACCLANHANAQHWTPLFPGNTLAGWTTQDGKPVKSGWQNSQGTVRLDPSSGRGGNIITDRDFGNFELVFEWKSSQAGNSGIKYRVKKFDGRILGCEYQMLDDEAFPTLNPKQKTASLYDVYDPQFSGNLHPYGQFNQGRIVVCGNRIEHWLNGQLVTRACVGSAEWNARIAKSKFADVDGFGKNKWGRIMLTDHNSQIEFRNVFIRESTVRSHSRPRASIFKRRLLSFGRCR